MRYAEVVIFKMFPKVGFYSIKYESEDKSEAEKFFERFENDDSRKDQISAFVKTLFQMGNVTGATDFFFDRHEGFIQALPSKKGTTLDKPRTDKDFDFDLRLFWYKISPTVVILFNGGVKNSHLMHDSPDIFPAKFRAAEKAAKAIQESMKKNGEFYIDDKTIVSRHNSSIEISV
jgi:hypothetical protein